MNIKKNDIDYESKQCGLLNAVHMIGLDFNLILHDLNFGVKGPFKKVSNLWFSHFNFLSQYVTEFDNIYIYFFLISSCQNISMNALNSN